MYKINTSETLARTAILGFFAFLLLYPTSFVSATTVSWNTRESMPISRYGHAAAAATNGKIYVAGGSNIDTGRVAQMDEYDPLTNSWAIKSDIPTPLWGIGLVAAVNGKVYSVGGAGNSSMNTVNEYDPVTNGWLGKAPMLIARQTFGLVQADNEKLYAIGGGIINGNLTVTTNAVEEYDPATDTWSTKTSMPTARGGLGAAKASNGKIYAIGGFTSEPDYVTLDTVEEYDPIADIWTTKASMPTARYHLTVVADGGKIYAIGGHNRAGETFDLVEEYDPATDTWSTKTSMPTARYNLAAAVGNNGKVYAMGGWVVGSTLTTDTVEEATITKELTSLDPAKIWVGLKNTTNVGMRFDLKAEVYKDGLLVASGQVDSVDGGDAGFNNAVQSTIPFNSFSPVTFPVGSSLSMKVSVRNACTGSTVTSGKARLWFDSGSADSQFGTVFDTVSSDYFLRSAFALLTSPGPGPKQHIDIGAGSQCSSFKTFGTWSITL